MIHFGIISPPVSGHIHPFAALGRELTARGHKVTYFQMRDLEQKIRSEELDYWPIGESDHPVGSLPESLAKLGQLSGNSALRFTIKAVAKTSLMVCRDAPEAIRAAGVEALLVDQMEPAGGAVAEHLGLPFITVCNALAINRDPIAPPPFTPWMFTTSPLARLRNRAGYAVSDWLTSPIQRIVADYRDRWRLPSLESPDDSFSRLAQICQMTKEFDFPRSSLPASFRYVGPLRRERPGAVEFPWDRLDGRPLVYASLGTLQNSREALFRCFAEACLGLDVQLVMSHGGGLTDDQARSLPGNALVVRYAPQWKLLGRASLTVTHAGLNTVLDSLANGVPLVAVPITYEQPAIARRIERAGCGMSIELKQLTSRGLGLLIRAVLAEPSYARSARVIARSSQAAGGVQTAANEIETVLGPRRSYRPGSIS
jgi:MGT family glycosyltransferase